MLKCRPCVVLLVVVTGCGQVSDSDGVDARPTDASTCVPSPPSTVARWRGEMDTSDDVGRYDGAAQGGLAYTTGRRGYAFLLDGVDDAVVIQDGDVLWPAASFSLEGWVRTASPGHLVSKYQCGNLCPPGVFGYWNLYVDSEGNANFAFRPDADISIIHAISPGPVNDDQWHHLVGVRDIVEAELVLYVDGALASSIPLSGDQLGPTSNTDNEVDAVVIGAAVAPGQPNLETFLAGSIDEVAYYDDALTAAEVAAIYGAPDGFCP